MDSRKVKKFVLNNLAYVIFGYAGNIICFAFRTAEGKDVSEKILPALTNLGTAFAHILPSFTPIDLLVGIAIGIAIKFIMKMRAANKKKFRQGTEYGSAVWGTEKDIEPYMDLKDKNNNVILTAQCEIKGYWYSLILIICLIPIVNKSARKSGIFRMKFRLRFLIVGSGVNFPI